MSKLRNTHCRRETVKILKNEKNTLQELENVEIVQNEEHTLQDLGYGKKTDKRGKWDTHMLGHEIWQKTLKNV